MTRGKWRREGLRGLWKDRASVRIPGRSGEPRAGAGRGGSAALLAPSPGLPAPSPPTPAQMGLEGPPAAPPGQRHWRGQAPVVRSAAPRAEPPRVLPRTGEAWGTNAETSASHSFLSSTPRCPAWLWVLHDSWQGRCGWQQRIPPPLTAICNPLALWVAGDRATSSASPRRLHGMRERNKSALTLWDAKDSGRWSSRAPLVEFLTGTRRRLPLKPSTQLPSTPGQCPCPVLTAVLFKTPSSALEACLWLAPGPADLRSSAAPGWRQALGRRPAQGGWLCWLGGGGPTPGGWQGAG